MLKWKNMKPLYKGMILIILSAFFFALMNMFVHLSGELPSVQKSFFRNFVAFIFAGIILLKDGKSVKLTKNAVLPLFLRSLFGTIGILCNFYALDKLDLADASILNKMSPFFCNHIQYIHFKRKNKTLANAYCFRCIGRCNVRSKTKLRKRFHCSGTYSSLRRYVCRYGVYNGKAAGAKGSERCFDSLCVFGVLVPCHSTVSDIQIYTDVVNTAYYTASCGTFGGRRSVYYNFGILLCSCKRCFGL